MGTPLPNPKHGSSYRQHKGPKVCKTWGPKSLLGTCTTSIDGLSKVLCPRYDQPAATLEIFLSAKSPSASGIPPVFLNAAN